MASRASSQKTASVLLIHGDDEFAVKQRARQVFQEWSSQIEGLDCEIIDGGASNSSEALKIIGRLREALQTLPFFGGKVVWLQNCTFLGDERAASSEAVTGNLAALAAQLKTFSWENTRLLISAGKVDRRKVLVKTLEQIGGVEGYAGLSVDDRDWSATAEAMAEAQFKERGKTITPEALAQFVTFVGPNTRSLYNEVEKVCLYVAGRTAVERADVETIVTRSKQSRAFALGEALGDRQLARLLKALDDELWEIKTERQKSAIGVLYLIIGKIRTLIFLKEMLRLGWIKPVQDYNRFKTQLATIPGDRLPEDKRFNPLQMNPYVLFKAAAQAKNYTIDELVHAMSILLRCNEQLIFSTLDDGLVLQQALVSIATPAQESARAAR